MLTSSASFSSQVCSAVLRSDRVRSSLRGIHVITLCRDCVCLPLSQSFRHCAAAGAAQPPAPAPPAWGSLYPPLGSGRKPSDSSDEDESDDEAESRSRSRFLFFFRLLEPASSPPWLLSPACCSSASSPRSAGVSCEIHPKLAPPPPNAGKLRRKLRHSTVNRG